MQLPPFLKSRRFWALVVGAAVIVLRNYVPNFPIDDAALQDFALMLVAYILGISLEDFALARARAR